MNQRADVIVVGAGIVGCWASLHLARRGCAVTLLDKGAFGSGASSGNCGYVCPGHVNPLCAPGALIGGLKTMAKFGGALSIPPRWDPSLWRWLIRFATHCNSRDLQNAAAARHALLQSSRKQYQAFAEHHATEIQWQEQGLLTVYRSARDFEAFHAVAEDLKSNFGIRLDRYDGDGILELEPKLRDGLSGGWHFVEDAHLCPTSLLKQLRHEIESLGVQVRTETPVAKLIVESDRLSELQLDDGERLAADQFVFSTGAEAAVLGKQLGIPIPVVPGKGYSITIDDAREIPKTPMIFEDDHVAVTPLGESLRIGSTMQLTGFDRSIPNSRIDLLKRSACRHLRDPLPTGPARNWSGWRPMMPDGIPCIDRSPKLVNAYLAAGNGMIGIASGPATGQLVTELLLGVDPHIDSHPYRSSRFV